MSGCGECTSSRIDWIMVMRRYSGLIVTLIFFFMASFSLMAASITTKNVKIGNSTLYYNEAGTGDRDILFVHGLFASKEQWNGMMVYFANKGYHCYAIDLPGYGQSIGYPLSAYAFKQEADYLNEFIIKEKIKRVNLAASSMGAGVISLYAHKHISTVQSIAYIGGAVGVSDKSDAFKLYAETGVNPFIPVTQQEFETELSLLFYHPPQLESAQIQAIVKNYQDNLAHYQAIYQIFAYQNQHYYEKFNGNFSVPVLVVWGSEDKILLPPTLSEIKMRVPRCQVVMLQNCGHLPMIESMDETCMYYYNFLTKA